MPRPPKRPRYTLEEGLFQSEAQGSVYALVLPAEEEDTSSSSSTCSSSFPSSFSSYSSFSEYPLSTSAPSSPREFDTTSETESPPQSPSSSWVSSTYPATPSSLSSSQEDEGPATFQTLPGAESLPRCVIEDKVTILVEFLLLKYRINEQTTQAEMLDILQEYKDHSAVIFGEAFECMKLVYGLDVKEVDPISHSYVLVINLGLTYDGMLNDGRSRPKSGLLILIISIIFIEGGCVPEERMWEVLNILGIPADRLTCTYGGPRELITKDFVQEQYLEYRQVPNSHPAHYEFLWGPRTHAETSKMKVLEFLAQINETDPRSYPCWYEEALRDEEWRAQARIGTTDNTTAMASTSSCAMASSLSYPE